MVRTLNDPVTVANRLRPVLLRLARELRRETHSLGVTSGQVSLLSAIEDAPGITQAALAEHERVSAPAMSGQLVRLETAGLIERTRNGRRMGLALTGEGTQVVRSVRKRRTAWLANRLKSLSDDEQELVEAAIDPLAKLLEAAE